MLGAVAMMMVAAGVLAAWKDLPGLLIGRLLTGVSVGLAAGTAITYLDRVASPRGSEGIGRPCPDHRHVGQRRRTRSRSVDRRLSRAVGELPAHGALPRVPRARGGRPGRPVGSCPRRARRLREPTANSRPVRRRSARLPVPAAAATLSAFSANGPVRRAVRALPRHDVCTVPPTPCPARRCSWCSPAVWRPSWRRPNCERRACSHSARSPCWSVSCCSSSPCAFRRRASPCS